MPFPIIAVTPDQVVGDEQLGSKNKFWFQLGDDRWLFKEARDNTGEDWAEKIASEVAKVVGIETADVELAEFQGKRGCASKSFVIARKGLSLLHGNEILAGQIIGYDRTKKLHQADHTLDNIVRAMQQLFPPAISQKPLTKLASYIVLDALICNTDRHHENWGLLWRITEDQGPRRIQFSVAPTFDHASSLGRELLDEKRADLLRSGGVERYIRKGRGGIFFDKNDSKGANPMHLIELAAPKFPTFFGPALELLGQASLDRLTALADEVPDARISKHGKDFMKALLTYTYRTLIGIPK